MSTYCKTLLEAQRSINYYMNHPDFSYDIPDLNYKPAPDGYHWIIYHRTTGEILSPISEELVDELVEKLNNM
jgi:hypothetical protein